MTNADETSPAQHEPISRRTALSKLALGGGVLVAGAVAGAGTAAATTSGGGWKRETVEFDVACLGETWRDSPFNYADDDGDFRGAPFSVEGWIYPSGQIPTPGEGYVPSQQASIGRWFCRGFLLVHAQRIEPHTQTNQEFVFGPQIPGQLFPDDTLSTCGIEGTFETNEVSRRPIIGGTGRYAAASGENFQAWNGFNTSIFTDGTGNAPNFQMRFELLLPDV